MNQGSKLLLALALAGQAWAAETCTTQSAMAAPDRTAIADAARTVALAVQANDAATLRGLSTPEIQQNFGALQYMVATTAPKLAGAAPQVEEVYLLDASTMKAGDSSSEAQFFCSLNKTTQEVDFSIAGLPPARYGFAIVNIPSKPTAWKLSMLLKQEAGGKWLIAGFYPKPLALAGHDGLWYWTQARSYAQNKQQWDAWLYYGAAQTLLRPTDFMLTSHLDKLRTEMQGATPPALSDGISPNTPLVLKGPGGASGAAAAGGTKPAAAAAPNGTAQDSAGDFRFTAMSVADPTAPGGGLPMLSVHMSAAALPEPTAVRQRNLEAARALLGAYPELRKAFDAIAVTTEMPDQPPLTTTFAMAEVR